MPKLTGRMDVIGPDSLLFTGQRVTEVKIIIFASKLLSEVYAWKKKNVFLSVCTMFLVFAYNTHRKLLEESHLLFLSSTHLIFDTAIKEKARLVPL